MNIKGLVVNMNNKLNRIFPSFNPFSSKFSPRDRLIDIFPSCFSFYSMDRKSKESSELILQVSADSKIAVVVSDMSIKNQVATLITYIHVYNNPVIKTLYHAINDTSTKTKIFAIRCGINQATQLININCIIVITDLIYATKRIFDLSVYLYQI